MIRVRDLVVRFGAITALELPSLEVAAGERLVVTGANGTGKSTLMRVLGGLQPPSSGLLEGVPPPGRSVLVHQKVHLFRGTARDNVAYALRLHKRSPERAASWLDRVGAAHLADRLAGSLSEGERVRVAVARALAAEPELLLLDETFASLDEDGCRAVRAAVVESGATLVCATPASSREPSTRELALPARS